ncbi:MAG TPA: hypothetical protein VJ698_15465 [Noviherbaspirillum sp.]|uniref:hypothetical protein n=1 Tax=Noviherbaspirillum sp. TaxID=1926288 RepID=UPI002B47FB40|nr:hypothetical protein [Noviherbaspirillum sp.]HJV86863.1 hypothetical protein [Noviherbaspirillum sp.]
MTSVELPFIARMLSDKLELAAVSPVAPITKTSLDEDESAYQNATEQPDPGSACSLRILIGAYGRALFRYAASRTWWSLLDQAHSRSADSIHEGRICGLRDSAADL